METTTIAIIGAGLTGCSAALELAGRGHDVVLVDQDARPMSRASLRNEGKIHLGMVYANDATATTGLLQLKAALRFRTLLARWLRGGEHGIRTSAPFDYVVAGDSLLGPAKLAEFYGRIEAAYREEIAADPTLDYLGERPERLFAAVPAAEATWHFVPGSFQAVFRTVERAIDTDDLATRVRAAITATPNIRFRACHEVRGIFGRDDRLVVEGAAGGGTFAIVANQVVNATWERRLALDRTFGLHAAPGVLHRLKYRVVARMPAELRGAPSVTMVLGRYGDVVIRPDDTVYLSWYPAGLQGWTNDIEPPRSWDAACRGEPPPDIASRVARETIAAIGAWMPAVAGIQALTIDAGAIVAHGRTDVDDPASGLHDRSRVGIVSSGGYHSVDPGKLTTAPLFGLDVADRVDLALRENA